MAENITLGTVSSFTNDSSAVATVNNNSVLIQNAFQNVLDRNGTAPNAMNAALDMNNFNIINLPAPQTLASPLRLGDVSAVHGPAGPAGPTGPTGATGPAGAGPWVYLTDFGVVGDNFTDDTTALNNAFASLTGSAGTIMWNVGICKTTGPVYIGAHGFANNSGPASFINIRCPKGPNNSGIRYVGSTSGQALVFGTNKYFTCEGLNVSNGGALGTTVGIALGGQGVSGSGNQVIAGNFLNCTVVGFNTGIQAGINFGDASECIFDNLHLYNNNTGFIAQAFDSLDFLFNELGLSSNNIGLDTGASEGFQVVGGSGSLATTADFVVRQNGRLSLRGWRSEGAGLVVQGINGVLYMTGCSCNAPAATKSVGGTFLGEVTLIGNRFDGLVELNGPPQHITMIDNLVKVNTVNGGNLPYTVDLSNVNNQNTPTHVYLKNNRSNDTPTAFNLHDVDGCIKDGYNNTGPSCKLYDPCIIKINQLNNAANTGQFLGIDSLALCHVRHLSEGTVPGALPATNTYGVPNPGQNLRVSGKFASSGTLAITFKRNINISANGPALGSTAAFLPTDVGKPIKMAGKGTNGWTDWFGYVLSFTDSSNIIAQPAPGNVALGFFGATASVIGLDEPDGNYMVAGLVGDANETFWVTNITSTGFTVHSSNSSSTATVTALIVR